MNIRRLLNYAKSLKWYHALFVAIWLALPVVASTISPALGYGIAAAFFAIAVAICYSYRWAIAMKCDRCNERFDLELALDGCVQMHLCPACVIAQKEEDSRSGLVIPPPRRSRIMPDCRRVPRKPAIHTSPAHTLFDSRPKFKAG